MNIDHINIAALVGLLEQSKSGILLRSAGPAGRVPTGLFCRRSLALRRRGADVSRAYGSAGDA